MPTTRRQAAALQREIDSQPRTGTIERGHVYFLYRPRVQWQQAHSRDDVKNFHILLIPRPPNFSAHTESPTSKVENEDAEMNLLSAGEDAVPAPATVGELKKRFRLITVGKKHLPDPNEGGAGKGPKQMYWGTVTSVGDDLGSLIKGLGEKTYETKTRGTRHEEPARVVARGGYALVNNDPRVPSERATHLGYHVSHPAELGDVQTSFGIFTASSFVVQVKNPLAPAANPQQAHAQGADYPEHIMRQVFGKGTKGRESYGLRFASCETPELLDYEGAQLLLIASSEGEEGLEASLGDGRGIALQEMEEKESYDSINKVFRELNMDIEAFPTEPLKGKWV